MEQGCKEAKCTKELDTAISTQLTDYIYIHVASCQDVLVVSSRSHSLQCCHQAAIR